MIKMKTEIKITNFNVNEEICDMAGLNTRSTVHEHLKNLQKKGYIRVIPKLKRGIRFINDN